MRSIGICILQCLLLLFAIGIVGCEGKKSKKAKKQLQSPPGYNLNKPIQIKLPLELDEISGVVYYAKDTSVLAINDEHGFLYKIFLNHPADIQRWKFSKGADFEEVALLDSTFYVLVSNGDIIAFRFITADSMYLEKYKFPFGKGNEFEILYHDPTINKLVIICKDCEYDKKKRLSTFTFDPATRQYSEHTFSVDVGKIAALLGEKKMRFKPSAANINPVTGDLYLVSAVNNVLAITDKAGNAKAAYRIDNGFFKQPEGLTFTPNGTMIISNEAAGVGVADILIFPNYQKQQRP